MVGNGQPCKRGGAASWPCPSPRTGPRWRRPTHRVFPCNSGILPVARRGGSCRRPPVCSRFRTRPTGRCSSRRSRTESRRSGRSDRFASWGSFVPEERPSIRWASSPRTAKTLGHGWSGWHRAPVGRGAGAQPHAPRRAITQGLQNPRRRPPGHSGLAMAGRGPGNATTPCKTRFDTRLPLSGSTPTTVSNRPSATGFSLSSTGSTRPTRPTWSAAPAIPT